MKNILIIISIVFLSVGSIQSQTLSGCENVTAFNKNSTPDLAIIVYSDDSETVWNALRLANLSQANGDTVVIFVLGKGVDAFTKDSSNFNISNLSERFVAEGGNIYTCATCAKLRGTDDIKSCTITGINDLYAIIKRSGKVITF